LNENIVVYGAGVMGTALAIHLSTNHRVTLWGTPWDKERIERMREDPVATGFQVSVPDTLQLSRSEDFVNIEAADLVILAVASQGMESSLRTIAHRLSKKATIATITKGFDPKTHQPVTAVIEKVLSEIGWKDIHPVKIAGPLRAVEVAKGVLSSALFASFNKEAAMHCVKLFTQTNMWTQISNDPLGVDVASAFKNAYAIWVGIADTLWPEFDNPKSAIVGQAIKELGYLVRSLGGKEETVLGPAGVGDFYVTISGGRNVTLGRKLGQGMNLREALQEMQGQTIEGIAAARDGVEFLADFEQSEKLLANLPLLTGLNRILFESANPAKVLMSIQKKFAVND
jgi:glycerol-3-phosphate dehydrogenase (NAD(P)+)